jgi:hypothetical protein
MKDLDEIAAVSRQDLEHYNSKILDGCHVPHAQCPSHA